MFVFALILDTFVKEQENPGEQQEQKRQSRPERAAEELMMQTDFKSIKDVN